MKIRYGRGNVRSGKCLSGEMSSRGSVLWGSVRSGNCPFGEMSVGEVSGGEVSVGEVSVGDLSSGKCPVRKLSYNRKKNIAIYPSNSESCDVPSNISCGSNLFFKGTYFRKKKPVSSSLSSSKTLCT